MCGLQIVAFLKHLALGGGGDVFFIFCQQPVDDLVSLCPGHSLPRYRMAGHASFATTEKYAHLAPDHLQGAVVNL